MDTLSTRPLDGRVAYAEECTSEDIDLARRKPRQQRSSGGLGRVLVTNGEQKVLRACGTPMTMMVSHETTALMMPLFGAAILSADTHAIGQGKPPGGRKSTLNANRSIW